MRRTLESVALTLASLGLLVAAPCMAAPIKTFRPRVQCPSGASADRPGLSETTFESLKRRWHTPDEEDALSHALLKTLRVRPELFSGPEEDLIRYVEVAARNCLRDARARAHRRDVGLEWPLEDTDQSQSVELKDLRGEIERRLSSVERGVLACLVDQGHEHARAIARELSITRYQASQAISRIRNVTAELVA